MATKSERIRIRIKGFEAMLVDQTAQKIIDTAQRTGAAVSGPIPLPTKKEVVTILRAVHKYKDSESSLREEHTSVLSTSQSRLQRRLMLLQTLSFRQALTSKLNFDVINCRGHVELNSTNNLRRKRK